MTEILHRNFEEKFSRMQKMTSRKIFRHFLHAIQFSFLKNSLVQINSKLNSKSYDYLY